MSRLRITRQTCTASYGGERELMIGPGSWVFPDRTIKYLGPADGTPGMADVQ